jgi:hypothetical protein
LAPAQIYEDGLNVSDRAVVEAAGRELGLEGVEELLRSDEGQREVLKVRLSRPRPARPGSARGPDGYVPVLPVLGCRGAGSFRMFLSGPAGA